MFTKYDGKLGIREYGALVTVVTAIKICDQTPVFVFEVSKNAGWMLPAVSVAIVIPSYIMLLILIKRYKNKNLMDIVFNLLGRYAGFIIGMLFFISAFSFTVVASRSYVDILSEMFFPRTPSIVLYAVLMVTSFFIAKRGAEAIGRVSFLTQPYVKVIIGIMIMLALKQVNFGFLYPIAGAGVKQIIYGGVQYSTFCQELILFAVFFPMVRGYKEFKMGSIIGFSMGIVEQIFFFILYVGILDYPPLIINNFTYQAVARVLYSGRFISNLEGIFLLAWIVDSSIFFAIYIYVSSAYFAYSLKLPEFKVFLLPFAALSIMLGMIPDNNFVNAVIMRDYILKVNWIFIFGMPLILLIISQIKGDYKNENS
ncbi:MAG: GerAB/ArcD/ProY family transporter [Bacillota bacterium]|nr:GerAB/ArcD/ProY family transporter [Bacillota bacterium]